MLLLGESTADDDFVVVGAFLDAEGVDTIPDLQRQASVDSRSPQPGLAAAPTRRICPCPSRGPWWTTYSMVRQASVARTIYANWPPARIALHSTACRPLS